MTESSPAPAPPPSRPRWFTFFTATTIGLLALNAALLLTGSDPPPTGVLVFYWQQLNNYLYTLRFWGVIAAPICVAIWWVAFFRRRRRPEAFVALLAAACLAGACLCSNYWAIFVSSFTGPADGLTFNARTYQLVETTHYDDPERLYLGECDAAGL